MLLVSDRANGGAARCIAAAVVLMRAGQLLPGPTRNAAHSADRKNRLPPLQAPVPTGMVASAWAVSVCTRTVSVCACASARNAFAYKGAVGTTSGVLLVSDRAGRTQPTARADCHRCKHGRLEMRAAVGGLGMHSQCG